MAEKLYEVEQRGWTHGEVIGEHQQYFFKRLFKLEPDILQEVAKEKIISKKEKRNIEASSYDMDYFLAIIKKKNVAKFAKFLEVLETTFNWNENHKTLVSTMAKHLGLISDAQEEDKAIIERVVRNASDTGTECEQTILNVEGQTTVTGLGSGSQTLLGPTGQKALEEKTSQIESESQALPVGETSLQEPQIVVGSKFELGAPPQSLSITPPETLSQESSTENKGTCAVSETTDPGVEVVGLNEGHVAQKMNISEGAVNMPPKGFIEPPMLDIFPRERLVNDMWTYYSPEHGVTVLIHKDTVPDDINTIAVKMYAYLYGPFKIHEEYEICSAILVIQMYPKFKFLKPVTLKIPHSVLFDDHDEPEDFVVLRATDPVIAKPDTSTPTFPDTHSVTPPDMQSTTQSDPAFPSSLNPDTLTPVPPSDHSDVHSDSFPTVQSNSDSSTCQDTQTSATAAYEFYDIIHTADFSEDFYVKVDLDHFSAVVAAKKRRKPQRNKRQNSLNRRSRSRRNTMNKRIKKLQKGDSIGSSRQSSYEGSFDREREMLKRQQSPLVRQCSSAESDGPLHNRLQRQVAITDDGHSDSPQQQSFGVDDLSSNEICIRCCNPVQSTTNWTTRFMVAPNHPTGRMALNSAVEDFKKHHAGTKPKTQIVMPSSRYIGFIPAEWSYNDWTVNATTSTQIHLDLVHLSDPAVYVHEEWPPHIDFDVNSKTDHPSASLSHRIDVTGVEANNTQVFFTIKSTPRPATVKCCDTIYTESWLYTEKSQLLHALNNTCDITLNPTDPDHCKLMADIAFQLPSRVYEDLLKEFEVTEAVYDHLKAGEKYNLPECMYKTLRYFISKHTQGISLNHLKSIFKRVGIRDIQLDSCNCNIQLLTQNPGLSARQCDRHLCLHLAKLPGPQWRFVGRYLGLNVENLPAVADHKDMADVTFDMLSKWQQEQYGGAASVAALVKAVYRIHQLNSSFVVDLWWWLHNELMHHILQD